jgi:hypothetical protein
MEKGVQHARGLKGFAHTAMDGRSLAGATLPGWLAEATVVEC